MPINEMNPVETMPSPETPALTPEREQGVSPEISPQESRNTPVVERSEPITQMPATDLDEPEVVNDFKIDEKFKNIENILEEDLGEIYFSMDVAKQQEFKVKGEETTVKILALLNGPKTKVKKVVNLIREWLKVIPGINKFFLEQSAKIKADKIIVKSKQE
jgi:hypothetical protein